MVRFDSGRICLDLLATGAYEREQLDSTAQLGQWLLRAGLVPRGTPLTGLGRDWPVRFIELRRCIGELVHAELGGPADCEPAALERVNALAAAPPRAYVPSGAPTADSSVP